LAQPDIQPGVVLDGFPRTLPQAEMLSEIMTTLDRQLDMVLYLKVADKILIERLSGRMICQSCQYPFHQTFNPFQTCPYNRCSGEFLLLRKDDQLKVVQARLQTFAEETSPLINYYVKQSRLVQIDGTQDIQAVTAEAIAAIVRLAENI